MKVLAPQSHAMWLVATADFQKARYAERDWARKIAARCSNPEAAFHNWMERDVRVAQYIEREAIAFGLELLRTDGSRTLDETADALAGELGCRGRIRV